MFKLFKIFILTSINLIIYIFLINKLLKFKNIKFNLSPIQPIFYLDLIRAIHNSN